MRNIIEEKPTDEIHGRARYNTLFVEDADIEGQEVLDIGCGFGWFELNCLTRGVRRVVGIEAEQDDLDTAKKYLSDTRLTFQQGSAIDLPFLDNTFDTVVSWEVIEHIPKGTEHRMFKEANRVLRPGGAFYLSTPYNSLISKIADPAWWLIGHRHYAKSPLTQLARDSGFSVEKVVLNGGWWEILGINNLYIAKWVFRRPPFFRGVINVNQDREYMKGDGFTNIFVKCKKTEQPSRPQ